jgi:hypothetical protein
MLVPCTVRPRTPQIAVLIDFQTTLVLREVAKVAQWFLEEPTLEFGLHPLLEISGLVAVRSPACNLAGSIIDR